MITKEEKALAIAEADGLKWDAQTMKFLTPSGSMQMIDVIKLFTSFDGLMPVVERINNEYRYKNGRYYFKFDYELVNVIDRLQIDSWCDGIVEHHDSCSLLDALLDAVYYVLIESKELK